MNQTQTLVGMAVIGVLVCIFACMCMGSTIEVVEIFFVPETREQAESLLTNHHGTIRSNLVVRQSNNGNQYRELQSRVNVVLLKDEWSTTHGVLDGNRQLTIRQLIDLSITRQREARLGASADERIAKLEEIGEHLSTLSQYGGFNRIIEEIVKTLAMSYSKNGREILCVEHGIDIDFNQMILSSDRSASWKFMLYGETLQQIFQIDSLEVENWDVPIRLDSRFIQFSYNGQQRLTGVFNLLERQSKIIATFTKGLADGQIKGLTALPNKWNDFVEIPSGIFSKIRVKGGPKTSLSFQELHGHLFESINIVRYVEDTYLIQALSSSAHVMSVGDAFQMGRILINDVESFISSFVVDLSQMGVDIYQPFRPHWYSPYESKSEAYMFELDRILLPPEDVEPVRLVQDEPPAAEPPAVEPPAAEPPAVEPPLVVPPAVEPPAVDQVAGGEQTDEGAPLLPPSKSKLRSFINACKKPFRRLRRTVCEFDDPSNYELAGPEIKFKNRFIVELIRENRVLSIQETTTFKSGISRLRTVKFPAKAPVIAKYLRLLDGSVDSLNALMDSPKSTAFIKTLQHQLKTLLAIRYGARARAALNSLKTRAVAWIPPRSSPRSRQVLVAKFCMTFLSNYALSLSMLVQSANSNNSLLGVFGAMGVYQLQTAISAKVLNNFARSRRFAEIMRKVSSNPIFNGIGKVASVFFIIHSAIALSDNPKDLVNYYWLMRSVVMLLPLSKINAALVPLDILVMVAVQLHATNDQMRHVRNNLALSYNEDLRIFWATFFGVTHVTNHANRLIKFKNSIASGGLTAAIQILKTDQALSAVVTFPNKAITEKTRGKIGGLRSKLIDVDEECVWTNLDASEEVREHDDYAFVYDLSSLDLNETVPLNRVFRGERSAQEYCATMAQSACEASQNPPIRFPAFSMGSAPHYSIISCYLKDGTELLVKNSGDADSCEQRARLSSDLAARWEFEPHVADPHSDKHLLPMFAEPIGGGLHVVLITNGTLHVSRPHCNQRTSDMCREARWLKDVSRVSPQVCSQTLAWHRSDGKRLVPYVVARGGSLGPIAYMNAPNNILIAAQHAPSRFFVERDGQRLQGSRFHENAFILVKPISSGRFVGGAKDDTLYSAAPLRDASIGLGAITSKDANFTYASIEQFIAPHWVNATVSADPDTSLIAVGEDSLVIADFFRRDKYLFLQLRNSSTVLLAKNATAVISIEGDATIELADSAVAVINVGDGPSRPQTITLVSHTESSLAIVKINSGASLRMEKADGCAMLVGTHTRLYLPGNVVFQIGDCRYEITRNYLRLTKTPWSVLKYCTLSAWLPHSFAALPENMTDCADVEIRAENENTTARFPTRNFIALDASNSTEIVFYTKNDGLTVLIGRPRRVVVLTPNQNTTVTIVSETLMCPLRGPKTPADMLGIDLGAELACTSVLTDCGDANSAVPICYAKDAKIDFVYDGFVYNHAGDNSPVLKSKIIDIETTTNRTVNGEVYRIANAASSSQLRVTWMDGHRINLRIQRRRFRLDVISWPLVVVWTNRTDEIPCAIPRNGKNMAQDLFPMFLF